MSEIVLKWYWRYHVLEVEESASVEAAVAGLQYAQDEGLSSPSHIEVISPAGVRRIEGDELRDMIDAKGREDYERYRASGLTRPYVAKVVIADGETEATFAWCHDLAEAEQEAARLAPLGARVRVVRL